VRTVAVRAHVRLRSLAPNPQTPGAPSLPQALLELGAASVSAFCTHGVRERESERESDSDNERGERESARARARERKRETERAAARARGLSTHGVSLSIPLALAGVRGSSQDAHA
jgi:hypothetical protein